MIKSFKCLMTFTLPAMALILSLGIFRFYAGLEVQSLHIADFSNTSTTLKTISKIEIKSSNKKFVGKTYNLISRLSHRIDRKIKLTPFGTNTEVLVAQETASKTTKQIESKGLTKISVPEHFGFKLNRVDEPVNWMAMYSSLKVNEDIMVAKSDIRKEEVVIQTEAKRPSPVMNTQKNRILENANKDLVTLAKSSISKKEIIKTNTSSNVPVKNIVKKDEVAINDDFVIFDYSSPSEKGEDKVVESLGDKLASASSNTVEAKDASVEKVTSQVVSQKSIDLVASQPVRSKTVNNAIERALRKIDHNIKSNKLPKLAKKSSQAKDAARFVRQNINEYIKSDTFVEAYKASFGEGINHKLSGFDLRPGYNAGDILSDENGEVLISKYLNNSLSILSTQIVKSGHLVTNTSIPLEEGQFKVAIPLIDSFSFRSFLEKNQLNGQGGHVLVDLDSQCDDVEVNVDYEAKYLLNSELNIVEKRSDASFALFVGISPGNTFINYRTTESVLTSKIIYVEEDELFFDMSGFIEEEMDTYSLYESKVMSQQASELSIPENKLKFFNMTESLRKTGINRHQISKLVVPMGTRKYFELNHLADSIFIGTWSSDRIEIPDNDYIVQVFEGFGVDDITGNCVVQLNIDSPVEEITFDGRQTQGPMYIKDMYLDQEGGFYNEVSPKTNRAFFLGQGQGIIDVNITYIDGTSDIIQTYCSEDTYLVEQL